MSRGAYDRVRKALEGTALAGQMETLNAELHLTPEAPEWTISALTLIGSRRLEEQLQKAIGEMQRVASALPDSMRDAAAQILRGTHDELREVVRETAADVAKITREAVVDVVKTDMQELVQASAERLDRTLGVFENSVHTMRQRHDKSAAEGVHAAMRMQQAATEVRSTWGDLQLHTFLMALGICVVLVVATAGITWKATYDRVYQAGYLNGAQVERAAIAGRR